MGSSFLFFCNFLILPYGIKLVFSLLGKLNVPPCAPSVSPEGDAEAEDEFFILTYLVHLICKILILEFYSLWTNDQVERMNCIIKEAQSKNYSLQRHVKKDTWRYTKIMISLRNTSRPLLTPIIMPNLWKLLKVFGLMKKFGYMCRMRKANLILILTMNLRKGILPHKQLLGGSIFFYPFQ